MTLELSRRLLATGTISARDVEATLYLSVVRGVSVPRALVDRGSMSERALEEELSRRSGAPFRQVQADSALVARLPRGLCRMLAAVPLGTDAAGVVELAVVDPLDGHVASEFGFHLGANVRVRRATMVAVEEAIRGMELAHATHGTRGRRRTPAFPHGAPESVPPSQPPPSQSQPEDVPIPLVRRAPLTAGHGDVSVEGYPTHERRSVSFPTLPPAPLIPSGAEDALAQPPESADLEGPTMGEEDPTPIDSVYPTPSGPFPPTLPRTREAGWVPTLPELLELIGRARDRDDLIDLVLRASTLVAQRAAIFVMRKEGFVGWVCNPAFGSEEDLRTVTIRGNEPSVLATSAAAGFYLGPIPQTAVHQGLLRVMGRASTDVAVYVVKLRTRPPILIVADELDDTLMGTRALGEITKRCGEALARLLSQR